MKYSRPIEIDRWQEIVERYQTRIADAKNYDAQVVARSEYEWLESIIQPSLKAITGLDHKIQVAVMFYMRPHTSRGIHLDYHEPILGEQGTIWAINIPIANAECSEMRWYEGEYTQETTVNPKGSIYKKLTWLTEPTVLETQPIVEPTLVYTEKPHDVINRSNFSRVLMSIRVYPGVVTIDPDAES